ncbi:MAG: OmpH family outer membrane protein [Verrucomicrobiota bacterium]
MRLLPALFAGWILTGGSASLPADEALRIAVVDLEAVFAVHPTTADATANLTKAREASRDEFKQRSNTLKKVLQEHQELIRAGRKEEAAKKLIEANEAEKRIATLRTTRMRDLEEEFQRTKKLILSDIQKGLAIFNEDGRYDLILDRSSKSSNGLPQVLHAPGAEDITEELIEFVKTFDPEAAEAP